MPKQRVACPVCGYKRHLRKGSRSICSACRRFGESEPSDGLTGGYWSQGIVKRWVEL